ncbi:high-temperature-induced dauer-formation protein-domain-containing protein [Gorgonomyces haynaldii]|nr:high-temperature-induced dauer-formation protein-domain-containing protein [Gorgonomyces haynaldii]
MGAAESKLQFRQKVFQLYEKPLTEDDPCWSLFFDLVDTPEDAFNLIHPKDIRLIVEKQVENLRILLRKASELIVSKDSNQKRLMNAVRILTRLMPYVFEVEGLEETLEPKLVQSIVELLFTKGLTLPPGQGTQYIIWSKGVGAKDAPQATRDEIQRRTELLRLLMALVSKTLYVGPSQVLEAENKWLEHLTHHLEKKAVLALLCSLLNTVLVYDPVGNLPYNHLMFSDLNEPLVTNSVHVLVALLDYQSEKKEGESQISTPLTDIEQSSSKQTPAGNLFRFYAKKIHRQDDLELLSVGLIRLLKNPVDASKAYLPGSTKKISIVSDLLNLLWVLLTTNKRFLDYFSGTQQCLDLVLVLMINSLEARSEPAKLGSLRLMVSLLHVLSQQRQFGVLLNKPFQVSLNGVLRQIPTFVNGSYADFVYLSIFTVLSTPGPTRPAILHLQESYLVVMANLAPLITSLTQTTANKLYALFSVFSSPRFLFSKPHHHKLLQQLLYIFNTMIQYQYSGNSQLVYTIVRNRTKVEELIGLTFEKALELQSKKGKEREDGFQPTLEWFEQWKQGLPLQVLSILVQTLGQRMEHYCTVNQINDESKLLDFVSKETMVGVLPQPHPLQVCVFVYSNPMHVWFTSYFWGCVYLQSIDTMSQEVMKICPSIWAGSKISLFQVK